VLDSAIDPARGNHFEESLGEEDMRERAEAYVAQARTYEDALDRARGFAAEEMFLIGLNLLSGRLDPDRAGQAYSALAQGLVGTMLKRVEDAFADDHGAVSGGRMAVVAMGKLGSHEMTAASDLDLILIYDFPADAGESDGGRPLGASLYYSRFTQRLLAALTAPTRKRDPATIAREVTKMRALIAHEKGDRDLWDLKLVRGGLMDIEFVAQYLSLAFAHARPGILDVSTRRVIDKAGAAGLLSAGEVETLVEAHRLYTDATQFMRLAIAGPFDPARAAAGVKRRIAAATGFPDFEAFVAA